MKLRVLVVVLLLTVSASAALGQTSSREDFEEWCGVMQGRWVGEVTLALDLPGLGKKGDKVTTYSEIRAIADGNALYGVFYAGNGKNTLLTSYDAAAEQIKGFGASSGGTVWSVVLYKEDGKWRRKAILSNPDGTKAKVADTFTLSDGGNVFTWSGTVTIDGGAGTSYSDLYRRVGK